ncbi:hypothetical protein [Vibrio parahaemolyticus]|uniref:hypothetical protein n=1 Tax=Vibrio parahaemolyticus TaxID=670 RepID=UPI0012AE83B8|nr:hypothetical protein [Vibrio parahaemolyticus]
MGHVIQIFALLPLHGRADVRRSKPLSYRVATQVESDGYLGDVHVSHRHSSH